MTARLSLSLALAGACLMANGAAALAADASKEISTAAEHAGMAASSDQLPTAQAHLQHVVNCLVGPEGPGYDASQEDPCKGQGSGAIPDASHKQKKQLEAALSKAQAGVKATDLSKAQADARAVQADLEKVEKK